MENENKEKNILTDEQLKEVEGGLISDCGCGELVFTVRCETINTQASCMRSRPACMWKGGKCVSFRDLKK